MNSVGQLFLSPRKAKLWVKTLEGGILKGVRKHTYPSFSRASVNKKALYLRSRDTG